MDWYRIFGILGIIGPALCMIGDLLLDLKGSGNIKRGRYGIMDSAWDHMDVRRFLWSILFAGIGTPLACFGFVAMSRELARFNQNYGIAYFMISTVGCAGSFFIHTFICLLPILYKKIAPEHGFDDAESVISTVYRAVRIPFWFLYIALVIVPSFMVICALSLGYLQISPWFIMLTPPMLIAMGGVLAKLDPKHFCDLPVVITPSLGLAMLSLMAVLNMR